MKKVHLKLQSLLFLLVMLCVGMTTSAEIVEIDGVFYDLCDDPYPLYDEEDNYIGDGFTHDATVTHDPSINVWSMSSIETYQGDIVIPEKVTYKGIDYSVVAVGNEAFMNCKSLTSVQLPSSVEIIYSYAFYECYNLTSVTMPGLIGFSGDQVFWGNSKLTSISLPKTFRSISDEMFRHMIGLTSITVDEDNELYKSVDGVLYDKNITKIIGYPAKKGGVYKIPATITTVASGSFPNQLSMDELIVPATVTKIESNAFGDDTNIKKLTIEDGDTELTIGTGISSTWFSDGKGNEFYIYPMFRNTLSELYWGRPLKYSSSYSSPFAESRLNKVIFGEKITSIPKYTFYNCWGLNTVDVKGGIGQWCSFDFTELGTSPFSFLEADGPIEESTPPQVLFNGSELSGAVVIPDEVTTIPSHGFQYGCTGITDLTLPAGLTSIADGAFKGLSSLSTIQLAATNTSFIVDDNVLYNKEKTKILCFPQLRSGDYTMPASITEMGDYQFYNCVNLTGVTLPNTIKAIPQYAFAGCTSLTTFTIPASVETIGNHAFDGCASLTSLTIPASVESIYDYAFDNCTGITNLIIEDATTPLGMGKGSKPYNQDGYSGTFRHGLFWCSPIKDVYIGRNIELKDYDGLGYTGTSIDEWNWQYEGKSKSPFTTSLTNVTIGNKVNRLPGGLYQECWGIQSVNFDGDIMEWCNITFEDADATPCKLPTMDGEGMITKGSGILYLNGAPLHSQVNIPEGATKIGSYAFYGIQGIHTIIVPSTVKTIEPYAFNNVNISEVFINAKDVISLTNTNSFSRNASIFVVDEAVADYRDAAVWSDMNDRIYPLGFLQVTVDLTAMTSSPALLPALNALEKVNGEYRISALTNLKIKGTMNGWDILMIRTKMPNLRTLDLSEATILDNDGGQEYYTGYHTTANTISSHSFYQLSNLRKIILPQNITSIDDYAFESCGNLQEVLNIPETCTSIGYRAFANSGLTSIEINKGVKTIGGEAFQNCQNLTNLTLVKGLECIDSWAFSDCYNLRKLVLPTTLKRIEDGAFSNCSSLTDIDFAEGLTNIGGSAFQSCGSLKDLHLPTSLKRIEDNAFRYCSGLTEVHVPSMITEIGDYAFKNCGLKAVYAYTITPVQINQNTFDYKGVDLYAPDNSFYAYYINTQWGQFQDVKEFPAKYTSWYTPRNVDVQIYTDKPIQNEDDSNPADGNMEPGSGLIFIGDGQQLVKDLIMNWQHGTNYPALIANNELSVEELKFIMNVYPGRWYFFSFPFDVKLKDIQHDGKWVWRYYDGETRAANGTGGWKDVTDEWLKANVGYIFQCNTEGDLELPIKAPDFTEAEDDKDIPLQSYESVNAQDASWNFIGNPQTSYYGLENLEDFNAPVTVWDQENQTYTAVMPGDDDYDFHPFEAFFVQTPTGSSDMTFESNKRETFAQTETKAEARRAARRARKVNEKRLLVNLSISDGTSTDKTRVIFNDANTIDYEAGADAGKFMSMAAVPQIYTLDGRNVKYAINARPNGNQEVRIGYVASAEGRYTIQSDLLDCYMALKDNETGNIHMLDDGAYTFFTEAGTFENRFTLIPGYNTTGIGKGIDNCNISTEDGGITINGTLNQTVNVYKLNGVKVASLTEAGKVGLTSGTYIVTIGGQSTKVLVK